MEKWFFSPKEAGTDEAGRGCLAGPVTAAAVILPEDFDLSERGCFLSKETNKEWVELYEDYMKAELSRLDNLAPRKWIQQEIQAFISYLKSLGETVDIEKSENIS